MILITSEKCLEYSANGQAESPARVSETLNILKNRGYEFLEPRTATYEEIKLAHSTSYIEDIQNATFPDDAECPKYPGIFNYASLAAGSALTALETTLNGENSFSLMRPPGHHAGIKPMGFCYFNNATIAALKASKQLGKVAMLDIDYHHGNGSQEILLGRNNILHVDIHEANGWPGTGNENSLNCLNFQVDKNCEEPEYMDKLTLALHEIKKFEPKLLVVSAGFDTCQGDPVGGLELNLKSYELIGFSIDTMARRLKIPVCSILEGGYSDELPQCILSYIRGFG